MGKQKHVRQPELPAGAHTHTFLEPMQVQAHYAHVLTLNLANLTALEAPPDNDPKHAEVTLIVCVHTESGTVPAALTLDDRNLALLDEVRRSRDDLRNGATMRDLAARAVSSAKPAKGGN